MISNTSVDHTVKIKQNKKSTVTKEKINLTERVKRITWVEATRNILVQQIV